MEGDPIFLVGCGRSGTTALGQTLGNHPDVTYFNEPRAIWAIEPRTDIWAADTTGDGRIDLADIDESLATAIRSAFAKDTARHTVMIEKTPINSLRMAMIRNIYPNARFLHLLRHGREVARSIAQRYAERGQWYGRNDAKWHLLTDYAVRMGLGDQAALCGADGYRRGLLEWRLVVEHVRRNLAPTDLEVRYESLVDTSEKTFDEIAAWAHLDRRKFGDVEFVRRSQPVGAATTIDRQIAGDLLTALGYTD